MEFRRISLMRLGLAASIAIAFTAGCGSKPAEPDTAEVVPSKAPADPAKPEAPAPSPAKEALKD